MPIGSSIGRRLFIPFAIPLERTSICYFAEKSSELRCDHFDRNASASAIRFDATIDRLIQSPAEATDFADQHVSAGTRQRYG